MQNSDAKATTVVSFPSAERKCPVGAAARHPEFGWCEVTGADGLYRVVRYEVTTPTLIDGDDVPDAVSARQAMRQLRPALQEVVASAKASFGHFETFAEAA